MEVNWTSFSTEEGANLTNTSDPAVNTQCETTSFFFVVYGPLYGLVCAFGLVGNSLSFAVLHKYSRNSVATFMLKALAISDNMFLATAAVVQMYMAMALHYGRTEHLKLVYPQLQTFAWPLVHLIQMGTVWMMVLIASNRYIAVCKPLHASRLCSKSNVQAQILIMCLALVVYNIPRFFEYEYQWRNVTQADNTTGLVEVNVGLASLRLYNILYENVAYCLFVFLLPLFILIFFNAHLVWDLKKAQRTRKAVVKGSGRTRSVEENNITLVMIVIIIVFIVCQTPASINQILFYVVDTSATAYCSSYDKYYHLSNLMILLNSSVNFIIYCVFRRQFQQELRALVCHSGREYNTQKLRRTVLLRAMHERTSSTYVQSVEHEPLNHNPTNHNRNDKDHYNSITTSNHDVKS